ncbi:MAG TPA: hypothetical protein VN914_02560 [Polyangia bacterium]|nr:hypothetical protein [Polyangia bacterium]
MLGRALLLLVLTPGCGVFLASADLRPIAGDDRAPVAVTVSAAAASEDLLRVWADVAGERTSLVLRLHLHNGSSATRSEDPLRHRLKLTGANGHQVTGVPVSWGPGELPRSLPDHPAPPGAGGVTIAPGQSVTIWVAFRGLTGLPLDGAARIELVLPGADGAAARTVVVSAPATPAPQWTLWRGPGALLLRAGFFEQGTGAATTFEFQSLRSLGPAVLGMTILVGGDLRLREPYASYGLWGLGLVGGYLPRRWPGLVVGVDGMRAFGPLDDGDIRDEFWMLRTWAAIRFQAGPLLNIGGGVLPVRYRRPSTVRSFALDVGYSHTFVRGEHPNGGGILVMLGAPLLSF